MKEITQKVKYINIGEIKPHPDNPRLIKDAQFKTLCESIKANPEYFEARPILVNKRMMIFAGNMRYRAALEIGLTEVPAIVMDIETGSMKEKELMIRDNIQNGEWDNNILANNYDLSELVSWGLDIDNIFDKDEPKPEDDAIPAIPKEAISKLGDIYQLGNHRIMCGNSTDLGDQMFLFDAVEPDMIFSDPPYGIGYEYESHDDSDNKKNAELVAHAFDHDCGLVWTCGLMNLRRDIERFGTAKIAIWYKKFAQAGNGLGGASTWEPVLIVNPTEKKLDNDVLEIMTDREEVDGKNLRELHSCPKPVALFVKLIESLSKKDDIIYDPFLGSGTTLIACEKLGRTCYGMEIDPKYVDVIVKRYEEYTGKKAVKITI